MCVDIGGIEEVDTVLQRPVHEGETFLFTGQRADVHRAEAQVAHQRAMPS